MAVGDDSESSDLDATAYQLVHRVPPYDVYDNRVTISDIVLGTQRRTYTDPAVSARACALDEDHSKEVAHIRSEVDAEYSQHRSEARPPQRLAITLLQILLSNGLMPDIGG